MSNEAILILAAFGFPILIRLLLALDEYVKGGGSHGE